MGKTSIGWTERTWNPCVGCTKVSPGCAHCYAEVMAHRLCAMARADISAARDPGRKRHYLNVVDDKGRWNSHVAPVPAALRDPFGWKQPSTVFVNSMSDLFHEDVGAEFIASVFAVMESTPRHTYQILTKRAWRMRSVLSMSDFPMLVRKVGYDWLGPKDYQERGPFWRDNVWLGVSIENRKTKGRADDLRETPASVRFLSIEPLLEDLGPLNLDSIDWVIVGGESGHNARVCDRRWIYSIIDQCKSAGVPVFVKQLGARSIIDGIERTLADHPAHLRLKDRKGSELDEWPEDLRIREMPRATCLRSTIPSGAES